jgi:hypothetical protein
VIRNNGGGVLQGRIASTAPWIQLNRDRFTLGPGAETTITATAMLAAAGTLATCVSPIRVTALDGTLLYECPAVVSRQKPWYRGWSRFLAWLVYGFLTLVGYLAAAVPLCVLLSAALGGPLPGWEVLGPLIAILAFSPLAFYLSHRHVARLDEIEDFYHRGWLAGEMPASSIGIPRLAALAVTGAGLGALFGWRFGAAQASAVTTWLAGSAAAGAIAGGLLGAGGDPASGSPAGRSWPSRLARTWSLAYGIFRSIILLLAGGMFAGMADMLVAGEARYVSVLAGILLGLLMGSDSHRWLAARLRWLFWHTRQGAWAIVGAYAAASALGLLRMAFPFTLLFYGTLDWHLGDLVTLAWQLGGIAVLVAGAVGGLCASRGTPRIFLALLGLQAAIGLPVFLILATLGTYLRLDAIQAWGSPAAVLATSILVAWSVRRHHARIETGWRWIRRAFAAGWARLRVLLSGALRPALRAVGLPAGQGIHLPARRRRMAGLIARWRGLWPALSLKDLSNDITISLAIGTTGVACLVQPAFASAVVRLVIGLGTIFLWTVIALIAILTILLGVRYLRNH